MWLGEGRSPLLHSKKLGKKFGLDNLFLKFEGTGPTYTIKDRMATVSLSYLFENDVREFVTSSTGNTGTAYAYGIQKFPLFKMHLFYHESPRRLNFETNGNIRLYKVKGDFVTSCATAQRFAKENNLLSEGGFFNPARREGLKMGVVEAVEQMASAPDWYFQAVSSAMGVVGANKAFLELKDMGSIEKIPKLACIQQQSCNPMVRAWRENSSVIKGNHIIKNPKGIAKAILRGDPSNTYPLVRNVVLASGGTMEDVSKEEILTALRLLKKYAGLDCGPASGVAFAGLLKMKQHEKIASDEVVLVNLTEGIRPTNVYPTSLSIFNGATS